MKCARSTYITLTVLAQPSPPPSTAHSVHSPSCLEKEKAHGSGRREKGKCGWRERVARGRDNGGAASTFSRRNTCRGQSQHGPAKKWRQRPLGRPCSSRGALLLMLAQRRRVPSTRRLQGWGSRAMRSIEMECRKSVI